MNEVASQLEQLTTDQIIERFTQSGKLLVAQWVNPGKGHLAALIDTRNRELQLTTWAYHSTAEAALKSLWLEANQRGAHTLVLIFSKSEATA